MPRHLQQPEMERVSLIKSAAGWSETSKIFNQVYNRHLIDENDVFGSILFAREKNV